MQSQQQTTNTRGLCQTFVCYRKWLDNISICWQRDDHACCMLGLYRSPRDVTLHITVRIIHLARLNHTPSVFVMFVLNQVTDAVCCIPTHMQYVVSLRTMTNVAFLEQRVTDICFFHHIYHPAYAVIIYILVYPYSSQTGNVLSPININHEAPFGIMSHT